MKKKKSIFAISRLPSATATVHCLLPTAYCLLLLLLPTAFVMLSEYEAFSQGTAINITGASADASSILDITSSDKGLLVPRMTTAQRNAIASPAQGLLIFNIDCFEFQYYNSTTWISMINGNSGASTTATTATNLQVTSFSANWNSVTGASTYYLDVSTASDFSSFVTGYSNLNVGNVVTYSVSGLTCNTAYYYRVRAGSSCGAGISSNTISASTAACFTCGSSSVTFTYRGSSVTYGTALNSSTGKCWLDRNLGASQVATAYNDNLAFGDLFQWGRLDDSHQSRTSGTTSTNSGSDVPGHANFILEPTSPIDWRVPQNDNLWQGAGGTNNPCPSGWRIPTNTELDAERLSWSSNNRTGAYASPLKLTVTGLRLYTDGLIYSTGEGQYWSSGTNGTNAYGLGFDNTNAWVSGTARAVGCAVRCIKN